MLISDDKDMTKVRNENVKYRKYSVVTNESNS